MLYTPSFFVSLAQFSNKPYIFLNHQYSQCVIFRSQILLSQKTLKFFVTSKCHLSNTEIFESHSLLLFDVLQYPFAKLKIFHKLVNDIIIVIKNRTHIRTSSD